LSALKLANVWRVLRDVNLDAMRAAADTRFVLPIVGDDLGDAERLRTLLGGGPGVPLHPWLLPRQAADGVPALPERPPLALLISRGLALTPTLANVRARLTDDGVPVVTVVVSPDTPSRLVPDLKEAARVGAPALDSDLVQDLAAQVTQVVSPDLRIAMARQLPPLRRAIVTATTDETAQANASYALATGFAEMVPVLTAPMAIGDIIVLTKNQLVMSYRIALASGLDGDPRQLVTEIVGVLGSGLLLRQVARQLVGLLPVIGLVPKVAIAYGGTQAIGRAVAAWAAGGRQISAELLERLSREGLSRGREVARVLVERRRERRDRGGTT
jgi:uncharacterized protein (DUF697 family)